MSSEDSTLETRAYRVRGLAAIHSSITGLSEVGGNHPHRPYKLLDRSAIEI
jgi:hypothetical protein